MNVLWIMCDQLRHDYLGCTGHPRIRTPNIDALAADGVLFSQAYVQSPICGPSRMSAYTGRYVRSHGSTTNASPLRVGEPTLGDHLDEIGVDAVLLGKTHMNADTEGMRRLGIAVDSPTGVRSAECGFRPLVRDEGVHSEPADPDIEYFAHLRAHGLEADNPWEAFANSAQDDNGETVSGWFLRHARKPARVPAHLSESAFLTDRALDFLADVQKGRPWVCHLSYIKPHWPYIAPAPYHAMYGAEDVIPAVRTEPERADRHPVLEAFRAERYALAFSREEVRQTVIPTYMGLITAIDDQIGRIVRYLKDSGRYQTTMIIFTSDHGDYLGDHWMGEKQLFHDPSVRVPLIVRDPRPAADGTRGKVCDALVEMIDIAPTLLDFHGAAPREHVLEGCSLLPLIEGRGRSGRSHVFSEYHYAEDRACWGLGHPIPTSMARMVSDRRWKLMQFEHAPPLLFDREADPDELHDLAESPEHRDVLEQLHECLFRWARNPRSNICTPLAVLEDYGDRMRHYDECAMQGFVIGYWDETELDDEKRKRTAYEAARGSLG